MNLLHRYDPTVLFVLCLSFLVGVCNAQDSLFANSSRLQEKYLSAVNEKLSTYNNKIDKYTTNSLQQILSQEKRMQQKVSKIDSAAGRKIFTYSIDSLKKFQAIISTKTETTTNKVNKYLGGNYFPYADTLKQTLRFLNKADSSMKRLRSLQSKFSSSIGSITALEARLTYVQKLEYFLKQRQAVLESQLTRFPVIAGTLSSFKKKAYYYKAQIEEYKKAMKDPEKIEAIALANVRKLPSYQHFIQRNSQLAGIFASAFSLQNVGLDTAKTVTSMTSRAAVQKNIQSKLGSGPNSKGQSPSQFMQQKIGAAQGEINKLKDKLNVLGGMGTGASPDFPANNQKTKAFKKRLQFGVDFQFEKSASFLPTMADFAVQAGYKISDKSLAGIGISYKLGLGSSWKDINLTGEGMGLRSFFKYKVGKTFSLQGGAEMNYLSKMRDVRELRNFSSWQSSALIGVSKSYKVSKKISGSIQLLFDALYLEHIPVTQPVLFRVGYGF